MRRFARLFRELDETTRTSEKVAALERYFREAPPFDAAWTLAFLLGRRGRRPIKATLLRDWTAAAAGLPAWLVEESYEAVGDLAETVSLLLEGKLPPAEGPAAGPPCFRDMIEQHLLPLAGLGEDGQRALLLATLARLNHTERFLFLKLLTGGFRVGVSRTLVVRALASVAGIDPAVMEHRLMREWQPGAEAFAGFLAAHGDRREPAQPYPFYLASPIEQNVEPITDLSAWQVEWKWDGIRAQLIRREGQVVLWSRGEEVITPAYPEIMEAAEGLPDGTVLDGELLAWRGDGPRSFNELQKRLGRKQVPAKVRQAVPVTFMAYDLLERDGQDVRAEPLARRRSMLEDLVAQARAHRPRRPAPPRGGVQGELFPELVAPAETSSPAEPALRISPLVGAASLEELGSRREEARSRGAEGFMLKRRDSAYGVGRERGAWWKWKVDPYTIDAVLLAAQPGHGRRAGLFTDYTFGIWRDDGLVPFAKAYSGLTAEEIQEVDRWVRGHTIEKHGPVRTVTPELVFELAFEGIQSSTRHKSGLALRFPRIARWRKDKPAREADRIETLHALMSRP